MKLWDKLKLRASPTPKEYNAQSVRDVLTARIAEYFSLYDQAGITRPKSLTAHTGWTLDSAHKQVHATLSGVMAPDFWADEDPFDTFHDNIANLQKLSLIHI